MGQNQESDGYFGDDPTVGRRRVQHYPPEYQKDKWAQGALTVEGKLSNFDLVYAGAYLKRNIDSSADYSDYTYFYDVNYGYGALSDDNGALYRMDWDDIQFSYLGQSGLTEIKNANDARVKGVEASIEWAVTSGLLLTGGLNYVDAKPIQNYCGTVDPVSGTPITDCPSPLAPKGTRLPANPELKGSLTGRYTFPVRSFEAHVQASVVHQSDAYSDLTRGDRGLVGRQPAYTVADLSTGVEWGNSTLELFVHNAFDEHAEDFRTTQCAVIGFDGNPACGLEPYTLAKAPRTVGVRFGQAFK